jgi:TrmH family RNA methyltransferase
VADARAAQLADLVVRARGLGISIHHVSDRVLAALAETRSPQGVVGVVADPRPRLDQLLASGPSLVTVLVGVADPGNAGTIIRTCDAFGVDAVLLTERSVDPHNGKCVRASAGSLFHLPVLDAGPAATAVDALHVAGLTTLAATPHGGTPLDSDEVTGLLSMPVAWLFGSEAHGLADDTLGRAAVRVRIPTPGAAESLNLAASAAVCLYATAQARTHGPLRGASPR